MAKFRTLDDVDPKGKRVLLRADLNVPVKDGKVGDATRIERLAPTIRELAERGARVVVMSHFGRPKGKPEAAYSPPPLAAPLAPPLPRPPALTTFIHAKVGALITGRAMANPLLSAQGVAVGKSLCERDMADTARRIIDQAKQAGCALMLPVDGVVAREFKAGGPSETVAIDRVPPDAMILDIGPRTVQAIAERLAECRTLV